MEKEGGFGFERFEQQGRVKEPTSTRVNVPRRVADVIDLIH